LAILVCQNGALRLTVAYVIQWKDGVLYYSRRVPADMKKHHRGKTFIRQSLKTRDPIVAAREALKLAAGHDALWKLHRSPDAQEAGLTTAETRDAATALLKNIGLSPGEARQGDEISREMAWDRLDDHLIARNGPDYEAVRHHPESRTEDIQALLSPVQLEAQAQLCNHKPSVHLSDALKTYLKLKGSPADSKLTIGTNRAVQKVIDAIGDLPLEAVTRKHATEFRDKLLEGGNKTTSVRRNLNPIVAVINSAITEHGLDCKNHFIGLTIRNEGKDSTKRLPFTIDELKQVAAAARLADDDIRHIVSMQLDTGTRAGEIIGLRIEDVALDHAVPHVIFKEYDKLGRSLKNDNSERDVPLIGEALWAAKRAVVEAKADKTSRGWLFSRYVAEDGKIKTTHAENTINKWLRGLPGIDKTTHSFRHAMTDRLREAGVPEEIRNELGGWGKRSMGQRYGAGFTLALLLGHMEKVVLSA
jgi:integrase